MQSKVIVVQTKTVKNRWSEMVAFEVEDSAPISGFLVQWEHSAASRDELYAGTGDQMESDFGLLKNVQRRGRAGETALELEVSGVQGTLLLAPGEPSEEFETAASRLVAFWESLPSGRAVT